MIYNKFNTSHIVDYFELIALSWILVFVVHI